MKTKVLLLLAAVILVLPLVASAQEVQPKVEAFGGYSYLRTNVTDRFAADTNGFFPAQDYNLHGWEGSVAGNLTSWFGVVGDFSGHYDLSEAARSGAIVGQNIYTFLFGPQFTARTHNFSPFVHALFGAARGTYEYSGPLGDLTSTKFAMALGGGLDVKLSDAIAIRLIQADWLMTRFGAGNSVSFDNSNIRQDNLRLSAGLVLRWR